MLLEQLNRRLIVSCQPVTGGPMDTAEAVVGFALAAIAGKAAGLRVESLPYVEAVRRSTDAPLIGIVKRPGSGGRIHITPTVEDAKALADAGADIIAFDATERPRPASIEALVAAIHAKGRLAMADCSCAADGRAAIAAGADCLATTLSGYAGGPVPEQPDLALISELRLLTPHVIAEGRIRSPDQAAEALRHGAMSVVVGSAITRTEHVTDWFAGRVEAAAACRTGTVLAIDIGGTKTLAALVEDDRIVEETQISTNRQSGPDAIIDAASSATRSWRGRYDRLGSAVTGLVEGGNWRALNCETLALPDTHPLVARLAEVFGVPALAVNDAQAAAWAEFRHGSGQRQDMVFLTISTGIGGGVIVNGRLLGGLAGHFGLFRSLGVGNGLLEDETSGRWIASEAARSQQHAETAAEVFEAAGAGAVWAERILSESAAKTAVLCENIQLALDPPRIVVGGGIGLAEGYLERVAEKLGHVQSRLRPKIVAAKLGRHAGVVGAADLAASS